MTTTTRPQRSVLWTALRRFGVIGILVGIVCGVLAAQLVERVSTTTYSAQGSFVVPLQPELAPGVEQTVADPRPESAYDASQLAPDLGDRVALPRRGCWRPSSAWSRSCGSWRATAAS